MLPWMHTVSKTFYATLQRVQNWSLVVIPFRGQAGNALQEVCECARGWTRGGGRVEFCWLGLRGKSLVDLLIFCNILSIVSLLSVGKLQHAKIKCSHGCFLFVGLCPRRSHELKMKNFFHYAQDNTKYDELENTKLSVCRVAYLMENSVRNFLLLRAREYKI